MFPNQIPNQINQQNDGNKPPNMGNMGNMGNMAYYPYHFINQQFPNQIPPTIPPNQAQQRPKKEPRKRASIVQVQSTPLNQPLQTQLFPSQPQPPPPPPTPPQIQAQSQDMSGNIDYTLKLMSISDDKLDLFCQLFDIPLHHTRQAIISYFVTTTINKLVQSGLNLLNNFFDFLTNPQDLIIQIREPKIPRIFNQAIGIRTRYILLQFHQGAPFEFSHSTLLPQNGAICIGQFVSDNLNNTPFGSVKVNDRELISVNFGEIGQFFLFGPAENLNHVTFQLSSTLIEHYYVWFVIQYVVPNHSFATDYIRERTTASETDEQQLVRTSVCNGCPPFSLQTAIENTFHSGFITCPTCNQKVKFDQIKIEYKNSINPILSAPSSGSGMNNFTNMLIGPQSTQIGRYGSGNSIGIIPMTPPQIGTPQQQQQQQQQKKPRQKKTPKTPPGQPQPSQPPQSQSQPPPPPQMPIQMPLGLNSMAVLKNIHGMGNMMQMKNMTGMNGMMGMNVGIRNTVQMNKSILSPPQTQNSTAIPIVQSGLNPTQNSTAIPIVQSGLNPIQNQLMTGMAQQPSQPLQQSIQNQVQIQIGQTVSTPNQQPSQQQQQQQQTVQQQQKQGKQPKQQRKIKNQDDEIEQNKAFKQVKSKTKQAKALSQPPVNIVGQENVQVPIQQLHHSSTPQFLDKQQKLAEKVPDVEDEEPFIGDSIELKKAKLSMSGFLCMNLRCTRNEINWKQCIYEKDHELSINDKDFHTDEFHDVDDYLDFVDSFK